MSEPYYADGSVTVLHGDCLDVLAELPDASVHAVVTDPPYGLGNPNPSYVIKALERWFAGDRHHVPDAKGFMGRAWDAFVPPPAVWDECLRVLKPGGHLLAFAGSRTYDLMTLSVRLAGFEIRDGIDWIYGSGFPKSQDVSKAIDRQRDDRGDVIKVTAFVRRAKKAAGLTYDQIDASFGTNGMSWRWSTTKESPAVPTWAQWLQLKDLLKFDDEMDAEVWRLNGRKGTPGEAWDQREVVGQGYRVRRESDVQLAGLSDGAFDLTTAATDAARQWKGWGTALKPAHEPIVMARKPMARSVAANVTEHGTGAVNIDGCRVGNEVRTSNAGGTSSLQRVSHVEQGYRNTVTSSVGEESTVSGRWPTNVILTHADDCADECADRCPVAELDRQSGTLTSGTRKAGIYGLMGYMGAGPAGMPEVTGDAGGASRFFPVFRYEGKAPASERPKVNGVAHPTVKPLALMRWLVRLVTPPGGTVLDPFLGSGTTADAARMEGFRCIGIERDTDYLDLIRERLTQGVLPFGDAA